MQEEFNVGSKADWSA